MCLVKHGLHVWLEVVAGSVADRERRKWVEKAVALSNNPYTEESIVRRRSSATGPEFVSLRCVTSSYPTIQSVCPQSQ